MHESQLNAAVKRHSRFAVLRVYIKQYCARLINNLN